jgi:hypothetical protein
MKRMKINDEKLENILQQVNQQLNVTDECKDSEKAYLNLVLVYFEIFVSYFAKN